MPDWDDMDDFFDEDDFAVPAMYVPVGGAAQSILVIVDSVPADSSVSGNILYSNQHKTVLCKTTDVPEATNGDVLTIDGVTYNVIDVGKNEAEGTTTLVLSKD